jgi:hypothetical protein
MRKNYLLCVCLCYYVFVPLNSLGQYSLPLNPDPNSPLFQVCLQANLELSYEGFESHDSNNVQGGQSECFEEEFKL